MEYCGCELVRWDFYLESLKSMLKDSGFSILLRKNYDSLGIKVVDTKSISMQITLGVVSVPTIFATS